MLFAGGRLLKCSDNKKYINKIKIKNVKVNSSGAGPRNATLLYLHKKSFLIAHTVKKLTY